MRMTQQSPVPGSSAEALENMIKGHKVTSKDDPCIYWLGEDDLIICGKHGNCEEQPVVSATLWVDYWCIEVPDGWRIYEEGETNEQPKIQ